jgi:hypothetical protein
MVLFAQTPLLLYNPAWPFLTRRYASRRQFRKENTQGGGVDIDIRLDHVYVPSDDIVAREIEGELIIVPLVAGIGDMEDELFALNDTGKDIWRKLDGKTTLAGVADALAAEYGAQPGEIERDVIGLVEELTRRRMLVVKPGD